MKIKSEIFTFDPGGRRKVLQISTILPFFVKFPTGAGGLCAGCRRIAGVYSEAGGRISSWFGLSFGSHLIVTVWDPGGSGGKFPFSSCSTQISLTPPDADSADSARLIRVFAFMVAPGFWNVTGKRFRFFRNQ